MSKSKFSAFRIVVYYPKWSAKLEIIIVIKNTVVKIIQKIYLPDYQINIISRNKGVDAYCVLYPSRTLIFSFICSLGYEKKYPNVENEDYLKPYADEEVNEVLKDFRTHPFMRALAAFAFPNQSDDVIDATLDECYSIQDLQIKISSPAVRRLMQMSSEGFSYEGLWRLSKEESYVYISNHRDIILDASLLNLVLERTGMIMTASAIGDNLVNRKALLTLSRLNRNFIIRRNLQPREFLEHSKDVSAYISKLLEEKRSVWLAQREGRTKNGDDRTQQGVLKMLAMSKQEKESLVDCFKRLKIVPVVVSYEFDPTDILKMPQLLAEHKGEEYMKRKNEDFNTIIKGLTGQKGRVHLEFTEPLENRIGEAVSDEISTNDQLQQIKDIIDTQIHLNYKLWPSNYVAYDMLCGADNSDKYDDKQRRQFERRVNRRVEPSNKAAYEIFLAMYANPVINAVRKKLLR